MSFELTVLPLEDCLDALIDYRGKTPVKTDSGIPLITAKVIKGGRIETPTEFIAIDNYDAWMRRGMPKAGDVVLTVEAPLGEVAQLGPEKIALAQRVVTLRGKVGLLDSTYLLYLLQTEEMQSQLKSRATGTTVLGIKQSELRKVTLSLPPFDLQLSAAATLKALDDRISLLRETNTTLESIAQALFKSWFVDFDPVRAKQQGTDPQGMDAATAALFPDSFEESELGEIPKGWRVGTVADIGEVICGKTPPTSETANYGDDVPFITIPDMHNLLAVTTTNRSLSNLGAATQKKKTLPSGSVCVSCIATAGLVVRVTTPSQTNQQINSVVPFVQWGQSFPLFTLRRIGDAVRAGGSGGSVFHNLSKSGFEQLKVLFSSEQLAIAFGEVVEPIIEKIIANQKQAQTLATLRDTLLPRLISGQLRLPA
jgi:type I restriction enzyme S subunit